jgi:proline dehydrogenase
MTRPFFLFLSRQPRIRKWMETSATARKLTRRFVAGETLEEALDACQSLQRDGFLSTLDHLGENVRSIEEAASARDAYLDALDRLRERGLSSTISLKLTQMGLDFSEDPCIENLRALVRRASAAGTHIEVDMESTAYTGRTLDVVEKIAGECGCVRAVIQSYLFRSAADIERLNRLRIPVRLVKGAYLEPESAAFAHKTEVDRNYLALMKTLLDHGVNPALATHDERILGEALRYARERGMRKDQFEFQMLFGIRRDLQRRLADQGYHVRIYTPYGTAWYPYLMRRLAERPANLLFLLRNLFR